MSSDLLTATSTTTPTSSSRSGTTGSIHLPHVAPTGSRGTSDGTTDASTTDASTSGTAILSTSLQQLQQQQQQPSSTGSGVNPGLSTAASHALKLPADASALPEVHDVVKRAGKQGVNDDATVATSSSSSSQGNDAGNSNSASNSDNPTPTLMHASLLGTTAPEETVTPLDAMNTVSTATSTLAGLTGSTANATSATATSVVDAAATLALQQDPASAALLQQLQQQQLLQQHQQLLQSQLAQQWGASSLMGFDPTLQALANAQYLQSQNPASSLFFNPLLSAQLLSRTQQQQQKQGSSSSSSGSMRTDGLQSSTATAKKGTLPQSPTHNAQQQLQQQQQQQQQQQMAMGLSVQQLLGQDPRTLASLASLQYGLVPSCITTTTSKGIPTHTITDESGQRWYVCSICTRRFRWSSNLKRHLRIHTGERPYNCRYCQLWFSSSSNRNKHERNMHLSRKAGRDPKITQDPLIGADNSNSSSSTNTLVTASNNAGIPSSTFDATGTKLSAMAQGAVTPTSDLANGSGDKHRSNQTVRESSAHEPLLASPKTPPIPVPTVLSGLSIPSAPATSSLLQPAEKSETSTAQPKEGSAPEK